MSDHAQNELSLDALHPEDVWDAISDYDAVSKDLPGNALGRAAGIKFERHLHTRSIRANVGWRGALYIVVTVMAN